MKRRNQNPLLYFVLTGVAVVATAGGTYWQISTKAKKQKELDGYLALMQDESVVEKELQASTNQVKTTSDRLAHLEQGVPDLAYMPTLLTELERIGLERGIVVTGVRPKEDTVARPAPGTDGEDKPKPKPYEEQLIEVKGSGNYDNVLGFLGALEVFPKIVRVVSLNINPRPRFQENSDGNHLDVTIILKAYLFPSRKSNLQASAWGTQEGR